MARVLTLKDLSAQVEAINNRIARLEARRDDLGRELAAVDHEIGGLRGTRGPGRPPGKRGPGRPKGSKNKPKRNTRKPGQPGLTDFLRAKIGKRPVPVARLTNLAAKAGYQSSNLPQVIRLMVGKAKDLKRNPDDTIAKLGKPGRPARQAAQKVRAARQPRPATKPAPAAPKPEATAAAPTA